VVFLNVISGPEISIGKYVNGEDSLKARYADRKPRLSIVFMYRYIRYKAGQFFPVEVSSNLERITFSTS
jgi:hypothetical protein